MATGPRRCRVRTGRRTSDPCRNSGPGRLRRNRRNRTGQAADADRHEQRGRHHQPGGRDGPGSACRQPRRRRGGRRGPERPAPSHRHGRVGRRLLVLQRPQDVWPLRCGCPGRPARGVADDAAFPGRWRDDRRRAAV